MRSSGNVITMSTNGGANWSSIALFGGSYANGYSILWNGTGYFISSNAPLYSPDLTLRYPLLTNMVSTVGASSGFGAFFEAGRTEFWRSSDGITWSTAVLPAAWDSTAATTYADVNNGTYRFRTGGVTYETSDFTTWTSSSAPSAPSGYESVVVNGVLFAGSATATPNFSNVYVSADEGVTWSPFSANGVGAIGTGLACVAFNNGIVTSLAGTARTLYISPSEKALYYA